MSSKTCVISCGIFAVDLKRIAKELGLEIEFRFQQVGLHSVSENLRKNLQREIDKAEIDGFETVVIGYGVCGMGTAGIKSHGMKLVFPRTHDCIALFLGSDKAYKKQFEGNPGTYYFSAGWFKKGGEMVGDSTPELNEKIEEAKQNFSEDNAAYIEEFFSSWKKTYSRAAYIDTGSGRKVNAQRAAEEYAKENGWAFEVIKGDTGLLEKLLRAEVSDEDILVVLPNSVTEFDPSSGKMFAREE